MSYVLLKIFTIAATAVFLIWFVLFIKYRHQYDGLLDEASDKIFTLKEIYFIGLGVIEIYEMISGKRIVESENAEKRLKDMSIILAQS